MSDTQVEDVVLSNLIHNESYARQVIPYLQPDYFTDLSYRHLFGLIVQHFQHYNKCPTPTELKVELEKTDVVSDVMESCLAIFKDIAKPVHVVDQQWLLDTTEQLCKDKAVYNAVLESISILDGNVKKDRGVIPEILRDALSVSFDSSIGHDYLKDYKDRYDYYHRKIERLSFDLEYFNKITNGGIPNKTLSVCLAPTGVGKTHMMCHFAASHLSMGKNVLYVTLEIDEKEISKRIDANLMGITLDDLMTIPEDVFNNRMEKLGSKTSGRLIVKEYPAASVNANHLRHLLRELRIKENFHPDIVYIDYINLCTSARMKMTGDSYGYVKSIAEELRGLGQEVGTRIFTATQTNRDGYGNSDIDLKNTAESFGLPATADFMFAAIRTEDLDAMGQMMIKQLKNRFGDETRFRRFVIGSDRHMMTLFDVDDNEQKDLMNSPLMDQTPVGISMKGETDLREKFRDFK